MRRILIAIGLCVAPSIGLAETYVLPVVTARIAAETFSTTTGFRNDSNTDVECIGRYVREDGRLLTSKYVIAARTHRVEPDTLVEARAVGSMRLECSGPLAIASRIQSSRDGGLTFAAGHVFAASPERTAVTTRATRTIRATGDLLALEPGGEPAAFNIVVKDGDGTVVAEQAYELRPHSQQHIGMGALAAEIKQARVDIKVRSGRVIVLEQSHTKTLAALAPQVTLEERVVAAKSREPVSAQASVAERLLLCPFKAAPFRDPATGLCFMRDRWYDPETGTFLTPDRSGYRDSSNMYAFGRNDPVNRSDPTGRVAETAWDAISLGIGGVSLYHNVRQANYGWAALDVLGIVVDTAAVLTPFVPGGAGAALKTSRATGLLAKTQLVDQAFSVGQGTAEAVSEYRQGNLGWGTFYAGMTGLGLRGMEASQFRLASQGVGSNLGNLAIVRKINAASPRVEPPRLIGAASEDFLVGEKVVSRRVFDEYIAGKPAFQLGRPGSAAFFFNRAGANMERNSLWAGIQAGFTRESLLQIAFEEGNELVSLRFDLRYLDRIAVPGVSRFSDGFGAMPSTGANALFTGNGKVRNMFGEMTFDEFVGPNIILPAEALLSYRFLGPIVRR